MSDLEKAKIILEHLDEVMNINWSLEEYYLKAIIQALKQIKFEK